MIFLFVSQSDEISQTLHLFLLQYSLFFLFVSFQTFFLLFYARECFCRLHTLNPCCIEISFSTVYPFSYSHCKSIFAFLFFASILRGIKNDSFSLFPLFCRTCDISSISNAYHFFLNFICIFLLCFFF